MEVVDNEARFVERFGLTHVVSEPAASPHLNYLDELVKSVVRKTSTHYFAVLVPVLKNREDVLQLSIEIATCRDSNLIWQQIVTSSDELGGISTGASLSHQGMIGVSWKSERLPGLMQQAT